MVVGRSAGVVVDDPDKVKQVHRDYFEAGADVATTASYQGSIEGYMTTVRIAISQTNQRGRVDK